MKKDIDDYLNEGIYGVKETKAGERKEFLGTLRERTIFALTEGEVVQQKGINQLTDAMKQYPDASLRLSGEVSTRFFKPYKKAAADYNIAYTSVTNQDVDADLALVLHVDHAIHKDDIYLHEEESTIAEQAEEKEQSFTSMLKNIFKR
ncbi:YueI family protein [Terribacillus sp. DMT04]|uniref:YueI family protein n=1 Tax=Terribacillus sp. DMT04 TaxID=2850441 RepID=UPI001C2BF882|nr:YueI family protein [Terribacillus sp. DMT04]QXE02092.1 YueI family protein [Terribacillus sp. DMT04]